MKTEQLNEIRDLVTQFVGPSVGPSLGPLIDENAVQHLAGDGSGRQYFRVQLPNGTSPGTLVVMDFRGNLTPSDAALGKQGPTELPFVNMTRHLKAANLPVPKLIGDGAARGFLLIEDLGDRLLFDEVFERPEEIRRAWYGAAVDLLARVHRAMWPIPKACVASQKAFDTELLRWELDHYREWGAERPGEHLLEPGVRGALDGAFDDLAAEIRAMPRGFVHRDYQSRNLMVTGGIPTADSLTLIDYQDALKGPRVYDLVALLNDSYVDLSPDLKREMVGRYADIMGMDPATLLREFHLVTIHRKLKDGARFVFFDKVKNNPAYLPFVAGSFARARESLDALGDHTPLKEALQAAHPNAFGS